MTLDSSRTARSWNLYVPKLVTVLREGYSSKKFAADFMAALSVAIVALPLSMALAIASGATPLHGLITSIVGGFIISALGGSRFQIGGPAGAFVVIVHNTITTQGMDGLIIATLMAGAMLVAAGLLRLGNWVKYIPYPVVTGFTLGIAIIIFVSQIGDLLGLKIDNNPSEIKARVFAYGSALSTADPATVLLAAASLAAIVAIRRFKPDLPAFLIVVVCGALLAAATGISVDTIGSRFGSIAATLPAPLLPAGITVERALSLGSTAFTIAFLAGIESLLSATVADGMTGRRHRSNCELVAQGIANIASVLFGGIPATGAIARTATNIRSGAYSPVSGMLHAVFLLLFLVVAAPLVAFVPIASLAVVLIVVAWNMAEVRHLRQMLYAPAGDRAVFVATILLTLFADLTVAIQVGVTMAAFLFVHRITNAVDIGLHTKGFEDELDDLGREDRGAYDVATRRDRPVEVIRIGGPFFFGAANHLSDALREMRTVPKVVILAMDDVPLIDISGIEELRRFIEAASLKGTRTIIAGLPKTVRASIEAAASKENPINAAFAENIGSAYQLAREDGAPQEAGKWRMG